ncbi:MAG: putative phosphotransferase related to Ser/Thr protein kinase [Verrucomicrobiales bacterium]|nr:putative phosphotransferase related to Ser/Thr protein kinase [Verrucomicrobiales bacterium]
MLPPTDDYLRSESCQYVPGWDAALVRLDLIVKGGSDRYYYRATAVGGTGPETAIIMVYTDKRADNPAFFSATEVLRCCGARTMEIYHHDAAQKIAWMEDLGREDLWERRQLDPVPALYRDTLKQAAFLHRRTAASLPDGLREGLQPGFDSRLYQWEQGYFFDQFASRFSTLEPAALTELRESAPFVEMADRLAALPRTLVHRDFQSQNIIVRDGRTWMIDYQGVREGRPEYDLASLLYDPYVNLTAPERAELFAYYQNLRRETDGGEVTAEVFSMAACQRLMQALGAYGKLGVADGKTAFLRHIPGAVANLQEVLAQSGLLPGLAEALVLRHSPLPSPNPNP